MTIFSLKTQLINHFTTHDIFDPQIHNTKIMYDKETEAYRNEILGLALGQLEEIGLIRKLVKSENPIWILCIPLGLSPKPIYLERALAEAIAEIINYYNNIEGMDIKSNASNLNSMDIARLIEIIQNWEDGLEREEHNGAKNGNKGLDEYLPGAN